MARGGDYSLEPVTGLAAYNDGESMAYGEAKDSESQPLTKGDELQKQYGSSDTSAPSEKPRKQLSSLWWYLTFWKRNRVKPPPPPRTIYINDPVSNGGHFCSNRIR